jgi:hypothetical protein
MKCIKCIKVAKGYELDEIRRVDDVEAEERVKGGYWKFVPKSEWKATKSPAKKVEDKVEVDVEVSVKEPKEKKKKKDK